MMSRQPGTMTDVTLASAQTKVRDVACGKCERPNAAGSRFCSGCGESLWEKCLACGAECTTSETYCGSCGTNVREYIAAQIETAEAALTKAEELATACRINEAIRVLRAVTVQQDSRLTSISEQVRERLQQLQKREERDADNFGSGVRRIRELLDTHAYLDAIKLLQKLPEAYQTDETNELLATATSREKEARTLSAEIKDFFERKQLLDLAPKFQRLLTLRPGSKSTIRLAGKVRDMLLKAAQKKLLQFQYQQARDLIARVPECAIDDNTKELASRAAEFDWLVNDLHQSPLVDKPLLEIAKRFAKKAPGDSSNTRKCTDLFRLSQNGASGQSARFPGVAWAPAPNRTHVGVAVDWLGGAERMQFSDEGVRANWNSEPGRYFVAVGLALQGLGRGRIETNLHKGEKRGLLGQLSIGKRKDTAKRAWGIDVGESSIKAVCLNSSSDQDQPVVECCEILPFRTALSRPEAETKRQALLAESFELFLSKCSIGKADQVCVSFPSHKVLWRAMSLPNATKKKQLEMVQFEAKQQMPISLDELAWAFQSFMPDDESQGSAGNRNTLLVAAKRRDVNELTLSLEEAGIPLHILQSDAVALFNFAVFEGLAEVAKDNSSAAAIVDVGTTATNVVIVSDGMPWFRTVRRGGDIFTEVAAKQLHLTKDQAEQVKFEPTLARRVSELYATYDPLFAQLTDELQRSIESFTKDNKRDVSQLFGVGGGFRLHGLLRYLRTGP